MRTTLILNDALLSEAKRRASERNASVSAIVNDALLMAFRQPSGPRPDQAFKIPTFAPDCGTKLDLSPEDLDTLMVAEELAQYRR